MKLRLPVVSFGFKAIEIGKQRPAGQKLSVWRRPLALITGGLISLLLIGALLWHSINGPNYGQVAVTTSDSSPIPKVANYQTLTTNFYSISYSGRYTQQPIDLPLSGILDQKILAFNLGGQAGQSKIEIDIKAAPYGGITDESFYDYYVKHLDRYKMTNKYYHGEAIDIARSIKGSPETAGLWLHNSYVMVVKITTADTKQDIDGELKDLLSSVQWRDS